MTTTTRMVLRALLEAPEPAYGRELAMNLDIPPNTVQRTLDRLEEAGWLQKIDEAEVARNFGDARHRYFFELTTGGRQLAEEAVSPRNFSSRNTTRPQRTVPERTLADDGGPGGMGL